MYKENIKEKRCLSILPIFGKGLTIFLLIFMQFFNGQITIADGAIIYKDSEIVLDQENKTSTLTIARIYVSFQTQIYNPHLIVEDNDIIVEINLKKEKKNLKSVVIKKTHGVKIVKIEKVLSRKVNIGDAPQFNPIESSTSIAFNKSFSEKIVSASSFKFKQVINKEFFASSNRFVSKELKSINLYAAGFFCIIHSLAFPVRPPPFLI